MFWLLDALVWRWLISDSAVIAALGQCRWYIAICSMFHVCTRYALAHDLMNGTHLAAVCLVPRTLGTICTRRMSFLNINLRNTASQYFTVGRAVLCSWPLLVTDTPFHCEDCVEI